MKKRQVATAAAIIVLGAWIARTAVVSGVSDELSVDTRSKTEALAAVDKPCDTRSFTEGWSESITLNTRVPAGTLILLR